MAEDNVRDRKRKEEKADWRKTVVLYMHDLLYMLVTIMVLFLLVFRVIVVSGSSMYSTLIDGDYLLLISNLFYQEPEYGDIIVASKDSFDDGAPIIKRVIATEGQTVDIDFVEGIVYVDGRETAEALTLVRSINAKFWAKRFFCSCPERMRATAARIMREWEQSNDKFREDKFRKDEYSLVSRTYDQNPPSDRSGSEAGGCGL